MLGPFSVHPLGDEHAGAQRALNGVQVQWQEDGEGPAGSAGIVHPKAVAQAEPCLGR